MPWHPYWRTVTLPDGRQFIVARDEDETALRAFRAPPLLTQHTPCDGLSDAEIAALNAEQDRETREMARDEQEEADWLDRAH